MLQPRCPPEEEEAGVVRVAARDTERGARGVAELPRGAQMSRLDDDVKRLRTAAVPGARVKKARALNAEEEEAVAVGLVSTAPPRAQGPRRRRSAVVDDVDATAAAMFMLKVEGGGYI